MPPSVLIRNVFATAASFIGATVWTRLCARLVRNDRVRPRVVRKLIHITTAPLFACTWPLYAPHPVSAICAAAVPLIFAVRIALNPASDAIVRAAARSEPLEGEMEAAAFAREGCGPMTYAFATSLVTLVGWRASPATYVALSALCFGDGMADVVGTSVNSHRLPLPKSVFTKKKTAVGSLACFSATFLASFAWLRLPFFAGFVRPVVVPMPVLAAVAGAATLVELFPVEDNATVPFTAFAVLRLWLWRVTTNVL